MLQSQHDPMILTIEYYKFRKEQANELEDATTALPVRPFNVLHITRFIQGIGGMENRLIEFLAKPMPGFSFFVFSLEPIPPFWRQKLEELHIPFDQAGTKYSTSELIQFALHNRVDLVQLHHIWPQAAVELKKAGIPILIAHDHYAIRGKPSQVQKYQEYQDLIDGVITVSEAGRQLFLQRLNFDPAKVTTIHNGVDFKRFKAAAPVPRPKGKKVVTAICRLDPEKGVDSLIKSIPVVLCQRRDIQFWIVGSGCLAEKLKKLATRLKVTRFIKFWGEQEDIGGFLASTDIYILPSFREPFSGALIEAAYFGKPAIAANIDGNAEIIISGKTGLLVDPSVPIKSHYQRLAYLVVNGRTKQLQQPMAIHPEDLGHAILNMLEHPGRCQRMGKKAQQRATKLFSLETYVQNIRAYYLKLLRKKGMIPSQSR